MAENDVGDDLLIARVVLHLGTGHEEVVLADDRLVPLEPVAHETVPCAIGKDVFPLHAEDLFGCGAHSCVASMSGSVRSGLSARMSSGGESPLIMAARLSDTAGECMTPWPLKPQDDQTPARAVSPTNGWWSNVTS